MDVNHINPLPGARPATTNPPRSKGELGRDETPATSSPSAESPDRLERSAHLQEQVTRLQDELDETPELGVERIAELREELRTAKQHHHEVLLETAVSILQGDLYFVQSRQS